MSAEKATIGVDIGGTSVRAGLIGADGTVLDHCAEQTPDTVAEAESILAQLVSGLVRRNPELPVTAVGLAVAGFIRADRQMVMYAPHLPWRNCLLPERISQLVELPTVMDHDGNSAAWAEYRIGAGRGSKIMLMIGIGTGIGAGLVVNGQIYRGTGGVAPELGHLQVVPGGRPCACGKSGCLERYCSGTALVTTAFEYASTMKSDILRDRVGGNLSRLTGQVVAAAAQAGDPAAQAAVADFVDWLGQTIAFGADIFDPDRIVLGGGVGADADRYLPAAMKVASRAITGGSHRPETAVVTAGLGYRAGMIGAGLLAHET